ncbi:MAG TPA: SAM-dependent chlorinase/fluorinase [Actinomycetota bacterium]|nr:SAM-dependent chlorinase/fluorinase [Actinomycetota bacterium]
MTRPIVFLTDYGIRDEFVGICHGVITRIAPDARVIDLTHSIARQDVMRGALALSRAAGYMPVDAVYCAVVDPGVGSERRPIAVRSGSGAVLVGPDNGLLSMAWAVLGGPDAAYEIASPGIVLSPISKTFHGRDIFAPAAAHLANGTPIETIGASVDVDGLGTLEVPGPMVAPGAIGARVMAVDGFGNVQLNVTPGHLEAAGIEGSIDLAGTTVEIVGTFADLPEQGLGAIVDSQGFIAIVVNKGSAAEALRLGDGATVVLE